MNKFVEVKLVEYICNEEDLQKLTYEYRTTTKIQGRDYYLV